MSGFTATEGGDGLRRMLVALDSGLSKCGALLLDECRRDGERPNGVLTAGDAVSGGPFTVSVGGDIIGSTKTMFFFEANKLTIEDCVWMCFLQKTVQLYFYSLSV